MWDIRAPDMVPKANKAPSQVFLGIKSKIEAISSIIPVPILIAASFSPAMVVNKSMLSWAPVNFKIKVCNSARITIARKIKVLCV